MSFSVKLLEERELYRGRFALTRTRAQCATPKA